MQEEDHDDPLRFDQRTLGHLDGPQVPWDHVKQGERWICQTKLDLKTNSTRTSTLLFGLLQHWICFDARSLSF